MHSCALARSAGLGPSVCGLTEAGLPRGADLPWATAGMRSFNALRLHDESWVVVVNGWWRDANLQRYRCLDAGEKECPV